MYVLFELIAQSYNYLNINLPTTKLMPHEVTLTNHLDNVVIKNSIKHNAIARKE